MYTLWTNAGHARALRPRHRRTVCAFVRNIVRVCLSERTRSCIARVDRTQVTYVENERSVCHLHVGSWETTWNKPDSCRDMENRTKMKVQNASREGRMRTAAEAKNTRLFRFQELSLNLKFMAQYNVNLRRKTQREARQPAGDEIIRTRPLAEQHSRSSSSR